MRCILLLFLLPFLTITFVSAQEAEQEFTWRALINPSHRHLVTLINNSLPTVNTADQFLILALKGANEDFTLSELETIVNISAGYGERTEEIALLLTEWLREDHPIYKAKSPTNVGQFRGYLLASLSKYPPNEELYGYVKFELTFSNHAYNLTAAAITARNFNNHSTEIVKLMLPYLSLFKRGFQG
jgi:hypothetical protein